MATSTRLEQLKQQREKLAKQIRREETKLRGEDRRKDTRRKILVGAILMTEAEKNSELQGTINTLLRAKLTRNDDRALFGLEPLAGNQNADDKATQKEDRA